MRELYQEIMSCKHKKITQGMVSRKHYSRVEDNGWPIPNSDHEMFKTAAPP